MRNFKKVLSLVLCMAMMLSVMVVGAGAAFKDQSKIVNAEAVDACSALNIINGYPDGSYKPEGTITRAEACKMICVALNGGKEPTLGTTTKASFTDTKGHWAEKYIESCVAQGIVAGIGGGKFNPNGNVTGSQFAKMLLIALGYNADNQGYTGAPWEVNVNVDASAKGLYAGLAGMDPSKALSRDNAAQMIWNALNAYEVEYKYNLVSENGQLVSKLVLQDKVDGNFKKITLLKDKYEADKEDAGVLLSCTKVSGKDYYTIVTTDKGEYKKISADVSDMIGMKVQVLHKDTDTEDVVYGVYADEDSKVIASGTVGQLENVTSDSNKTKLDGTEYKLDSSDITVIEPNQYNLDSKNNTATSTSTVKLSTLESATTLGYVAGTVKLIDTNGNNKVDTVVYTPAKVGQITYAGSKSVTINNGVGANDIDDLDIYKDYAKDDWTTVVGDAYTASTNTAVAKVDIVSAKVSSIKAKSGSKPQEVKINDTWYKVVTDGTNEDTNKVVSGSTYDFAIVGNYIVNAKETETSSSDILVVTDYETATNGMQGSSTQKVKAYFLDGTSKVITVEKLAKAAGNEATDIKASSNVIDDELVNKLYTYSTRSNGNYTLKALGDGNKAGYENINTTNKVTDKNKMGTYSINDDAVIFVLYNDNQGTTTVKDNVKILSGKTVNDWDDEYTANVQYATKKTNGVETVRVAVVAANSKYDGASSDYKYAYMTSASYEGTNGEDNDKTTVYEAWNGSENITLKYDGSNGTAKAAGDVLVYSNDGADFINIESDVSIYKVAITGIEKKKEGTVAVQGFKVGATTADLDSSYKMDEDCVYIAVNDDKQEGMAGSSLDQISLAEETTTSGVYYLNAYIVVENNSDKHIVAIIYDADNNRLDGEKVSAGNLKATDNVTVPAGSTLDLTGVTVAKGATVTLDKEAAVILPNGTTVDAKALKATGSLVLTANETGGVTVTAAVGTQITVPAGGITLGTKDGQNFYDSSKVSLSTNVTAGTYTWTANVIGSVAGWVAKA